VLLVGLTGAGKSTLVNTLFNFFMRGNPSKPRVVIPTKFHAVTGAGVDCSGRDCFSLLLAPSSVGAGCPPLRPSSTRRVGRRLIGFAW
jgi:GTPase SAR1 family protein